MTYDAILVPTDGSAHAERATAHALSLADAFGATVHAVSVVDLQRLAGPFDAGGVDPSLVEDFRERARAEVEHVENRWAQPDRFRGEVLQGRPSTTLLAYVDDHDIDLVAMGTHGRTGLSRFVLGSVTEHVLRASPVPVLATRADADEPPTLPYRDVLVPTDGSECATAAVDHAFAIATACGATVHAVTVVDTAAAEASGHVFPSEYVAALAEDGEETVAAVAARGETADVPVTTETVEGRPSEAIVTYAGENGIDLVAMGTHGRSGLDRFLLGSTTERVIRRSDLPVVAVPGADAAPGE